MEDHGDPAATVLGRRGHRGLEVRQHGARRVGVLRRDRLGVRRAGAVACHVDTAGGASRGVTAALDDALGRGVVGALRVGEARRVEAVVDEVLPVLADLERLVCGVGVGLEVDVIDSVSADLVTAVVQRGQFGPGHVLRVHVVEAADVVERAIEVVWLQRAVEAEVVLVLQAVVEGQRNHDLRGQHGDLLRLQLLGVAGQVGREELNGVRGRCVQRDRPGVRSARGRRR